MRLHEIAVSGAVLPHWRAFYHLRVESLQLAVLLCLVSILVILVNWGWIYLHAVHWVNFDG